MMEKYGCDMSELPITDDQIREIGKLCKKANIEVNMPTNREDASDLIEKLASEVSE